MRQKAKSPKALCLLGLLALSALALQGCSRKAPEHVKPPMPVVTGKAETKDVPVFIGSFGCLTPVNNVDIKAQVAGKVLEARFVEGQLVKAGDILFVIDKRPFQANLDNATGSLMQDSSSLKYAQFMVDSNKNLAERTIMSAQQFEQYVSNVGMYQGKTISDKAQIDTAKINLDYCDIRAPVDGITGKRLVDPGNIVTANDGSTLVNIKTLSPIYADFSVPEKHFSAIKAAMEKAPLSVEVTPTGGYGAPSVGVLSLIDNTVDTSTGTLALRATLQNKDGRLWPGQFITTKLILSVMKSALVVPSNAVQSGQDGRYVYVIRDGKAVYETVEVAQSNEDFATISKGNVKAGESVVTVGGMMLKPGATVMDKAAAGQHAEAKAPAAAPGKPQSKKPE